MPVCHRLQPLRQAPDLPRATVLRTPGFTLIELLMVISIGVALMATFVVVGMNYYRLAAMRQKCEMQLAAFSGYLESYSRKRWSVNPGSDNAARPQINPFLWDLPVPDPLNETEVDDPEEPDPEFTLLIWTSNDWDARTWESPVAGISPSRRVQGDGILDGFAFRNADGKAVRFESIIVKDATNLDYAPFHGYTGFVQMHKIDVNEDEIDEETGELLDPWGQPLRILFYDSTDDSFDDPLNPGVRLNPFGTEPGGIYSVGPDGIDDTRDTPFKANTDDVRSWDKVHDDA